MKRKYICIAVMVLMICALFPGMMISGNCESCSTENVVPYTVQDLNEFSLEADVMLDMLSRSISEKEDLLKGMLKNPPSEKDEELTALLNDLFEDYSYYLLYTSRKAATATVRAMTTESKDGYLVIAETKTAGEHELEQAFLHQEEYLRPLSLKYITLWSYYDDSEEEIDYCVLIDDIIALYDEYEDVVAYHAMLKTQYIISLQAESQEILTRDDSDCEYPGAGDSLQPATSYSMSNFRWVKAWVGVYTSQTPLGLPYLYAQYCTTTQRTLLQHLAYANDTYGPWNVGSIQVKYFFLADQSTHQHNAIYEGNHSNYNLNGNYPVGGATVPFTNGVAWTYGVSYDGSSTPSNGTYKFTLYVDHLIYDDYPDCCCTPSYSPDDTTYDQWCNTHCGGCFACDDGGDQNFIIPNS